MPSRGSDEPDLLVDTSVAVALVLADHEHHARTTRALQGRRLGLSGHAAFETVSVLTRLPPPARRTPAAVARLLATNFPQSRYLGAGATLRLFAALGSSKIAGGAVYDALVGATAVAHGLTLATRDERALDTYRVLGVSVELVA